jgi:glycosyltransferase involved in cell wall biosynthesis
MHWTCALPLRAPGRANLYTLHDMIPFRLPFTTLDNKARSLSLCREIAATADRIVTVSEHSKTDIVRILGIDEARVAVTYQSVDIPAALTARPDGEVAREVEGVFGLGWRSYFLFFGAIEPKKNLARVIEAYLGAAVAAPLVIIGGKAWLEADETRLLYPDLVQGRTLTEGRWRRADRVRVYDYLPFSLLVSLIRGARATLLPSLYEGFGLPVLESMLLGTPVLSSTGGALPEIAGDAAVLVDPYDALAIREAIIALDADESLRDELSRRGRLRAETFSPETYRQRLAELYASLA